MRSEVLYMQKKQNEKWKYPVWFLFYNKDESFDFELKIKNELNSLNLKL
jgi:hypothetical protein